MGINFFYKIEKKWWVLVAMICSFAMVFIDQTAIPVALPAMQKNLNTTALTLDWIVNAYLLTLAALTIVGGKIGDLYGHKKAFLIGLILFIVSSMMVGFAPLAYWAVLGRGLQGIGGAFMVPAMTVIVTSPFKPEERGRVIGILVGSAAIFASLGPLVGGALTEFVTWRAVFWINVPFALMSLIVTLKMVPDKLHENPENQLDWAGAITLLVAMFAFVFSVMEVTRYGVDSSLILSLFTLGLITFCLFIWIELRHPHPLIDLSLFKNKQISIPIMIFVLIQAVYISNVFWAIYFQDILHMSPAKAGLMMLPVILPVIFMPTVGGILRDRYGPKLPVTLGAMCALVGMFWIAIFSSRENYLLLFPGLLVVGSGAPLIFSSAMATAMQAVEIHKKGLVSGICGAARQVGASLGLAIFGSIIIHLNKSYLTSFLQNTKSPLHELNASDLDGLLTGATRAKGVVAHLPISLMDELYHAVKLSHIFAFSVMMFIVSALCVIVLLLAIQLPTKETEIEK